MENKYKDVYGAAIVTAFTGFLWWGTSLLSIAFAISNMRGATLVMAAFASIFFALFFYFIVALYCDFDKLKENSNVQDT